MQVKTTRKGVLKSSDPDPCNTKEVCVMPDSKYRSELDVQLRAYSAMAQQFQMTAPQPPYSEPLAAGRCMHLMFDKAAWGEFCTECTANRADLMTALAAFGFGIPQTEVTQRQRAFVKVITFPTRHEFGGLVEDFMQAAPVVTPQEAQKVRDAFCSKYPEIMQYFKEYVVTENAPAEAPEAAKVCWKCLGGRRGVCSECPWRGYGCKPNTCPPCPVCGGKEAQ